MQCWLIRGGLAFTTFDVMNDFSTGKFWAQIPCNVLAEFAEIFSYGVGHPLIFEQQDNSNGLNQWDLVLWFSLIL